MSLQIMQRRAQPREPLPQPKTPQPTERLERVRERVGFALAEVSAVYVLDHETRDDIARALVAAVRELEEVQLAVAVLQRKAVRQ